MTLSRRAWRALSRRLPENGAGLTASIRVKMDAADMWRQKRHSFVTLELSAEEERAVVRTMREPNDAYFAFVVAHECRTNTTLGGIVL